LEPKLDDRPASSRPHASHRQPRRLRLPLTSRVAQSAALTAALALVGAGVLVGTGTVKTPLSDSVTAVTPPTASPLSSTMPAVSPSATPTTSFALATVPASLKASPKATKKKAKPKASATPSASASTSTAPSFTPTPTPTAAQSTAPAGPATAPNLPENVTPTGSTELAWSEAILTALGAPITNANVISMGYWMQNEAGAPPSGLRGENNPINVSQPCCGGVPIQSDGDGVTYLQSYPTAADGVEATKEYLERPNFPTIIADLRAGVGLGGGDAASDISLFAGSHYDTIPDSWGQSQGQPETP
jgi:hypothetical protein